MTNNNQALQRAKNIRMLVLDVDGVLTDGSININSNGEDFKKFNVKDGLGIKLLQKAGISIGIITGRTSEIVAQRAQELGITVLYQGQRHKVPAWNDLLQKQQLTADKVAYMGDDLPDYPLLKRAGLAATPYNGIQELEPIIHWRSKYHGGDGAVRELAEFILKAQNLWEPLLSQLYEIRG